MEQDKPTLLDKLDRLSKRRLSDIVAKGLRRYAAKVRSSNRHFTENKPYVELFTLNNKAYNLAIHTDAATQMVTWVIHDPGTKKPVILKP